MGRTLHPEKQTRERFNFGDREWKGRTQLPATRFWSMLAVTRMMERCTKASSTGSESTPGPMAHGACSAVAEFCSLFGISTLDIHASCVASNHRYEGEWRKNVPHGTGKYSWPDGESYEGRFKKGRRDGSGIYVFANGASFVGIFRDDLGELYDQAMRCPMLTQRMATAHGKGICTLPGGRCFHGEFSLFAAYLRTTQVQLCTTPANPPFAGLWSSTMKSGQNDHAATESANHANLFGLAGPKQ